MRYYEVVFLVHPDQSDQVPSMIDRYKELVERDGGAVHRVEDWGRRQLTFPVSKIHKAHYILMNIEASAPALEELNSSFRFNDAVIRNMVLVRKEADTSTSAIYKEEKEKEARDKEREKERERDLERRRAEAAKRLVDEAREAVGEAGDAAADDGAAASEEGGA